MSDDNDAYGCGQILPEPEWGPGGSKAALYWLGVMVGGERRANKAALQSLGTVPVDRKTLPAFDRAERLLPHNTIARFVWLRRLTNTPYQMPTEWFPRMDERTLWADMCKADTAWAQYLDTLKDTDLSKEIEYTSSEGARYASRIGDVILHVHNHSTYHRGQLARLVKECGGTPAVTDLIALTRRRIDEGGGAGGLVAWE